MNNDLQQHADDYVQLNRTAFQANWNWARNNRQRQRKLDRETRRKATEYLRAKADGYGLGVIEAIQLAWTIYRLVNWIMKQLRER